MAFMGWKVLIEGRQHSKQAAAFGRHYMADATQSVSAVLRVPGTSAAASG